MVLGGGSVVVVNSGTTGRRVRVVRTRGFGGSGAGATTGAGGGGATVVAGASVVVVLVSGPELTTGDEAGGATVAAGTTGVATDATAVIAPRAPTLVTATRPPCSPGRTPRRAGSPSPGSAT